MSDAPICQVALPTPFKIFSTWLVIHWPTGPVTRLRLVREACKCWNSVCAELRSHENKQAWRLLKETLDKAVHIENFQIDYSLFTIYCLRGVLTKNCPRSGRRVKKRGEATRDRAKWGEEGQTSCSWDKQTNFHCTAWD